MHFIVHVLSNFSHNNLMVEMAYIQTGDKLWKYILFLVSYGFSSYGVVIGHLACHTYSYK